MQQYKIQDQVFNTIGKNTIIEGDINFDGPLFLEGQIKGRVLNQGSGKVVIGPTGSINGELIGEEVVIYGRFEGSIIARSKLTLFPGSQTNGQVKAKFLQILPGAITNFQGEASYQEEFH